MGGVGENVSGVGVAHFFRKLRRSSLSSGTGVSFDLAWLYLLSPFGLFSSPTSPFFCTQ